LTAGVLRELSQDFLKGNLMSHFYATIPESARKTTPTARGHKSTGIATRAASYAGAVTVNLFYDAETETDHFEIYQRTHYGAGVNKLISKGILGE
jgi:hypothetical protein